MIKMNNLVELGFCGWDCNNCGNYKKNLNCQGCWVDQEMISDCPTRSCVKKKGIKYCGECNEFPCDPLKGFYKENDKAKMAYERMCQMKEK